MTDARESLWKFLRRKPRSCDGSGECRAKQHLHGCFADNGRNCDHPSEHRRG